MYRKINFQYLLLQLFTYSTLSWLSTQILFFFLTTLVSWPSKTSAVYFTVRQVYHSVSSQSSLLFRDFFSPVLKIRNFSGFKQTYFAMQRIAVDPLCLQSLEQHVIQQLFANMLKFSPTHSECSTYIADLTSPRGRFSAHISVQGIVAKTQQVKT